jgi:hypothetical protein
MNLSATMMLSAHAVMIDFSIRCPHDQGPTDRNICTLQVPESDFLLGKSTI